ncbi:TPA_asm: hypothetical protein [ssRNA phage Gerhypos.1_5]|jgi:hypothetical protein|uniref:Uncharacterized protein n=2 Tax=Norzivirales TaxID=2842247 RepID=A0A8S5L2P0_9VIRU|nr:hypothetical protein QII45_gp1 [ssRNA phage Gerhypos.1_5]QDH90802.1 MAG: hypothetical protein H1Bulk28FD89_000004 [Leviviridae sp.]DAD51629.1 TPA_asm: hypothetical protein [ssRNA phage Gerhypos.1_5]
MNIMTPDDDSSSSNQEEEFWLSNFFDKMVFLAYLEREVGISLTDFFSLREKFQVAIMLNYLVYSLRFSL